MTNERLEIASRIMAGWAANPAVFAANGMNGWSLVNCTPKILAEHALYYADCLIESEATPGDPAKEAR